MSLVRACVWEGESLLMPVCSFDGPGRSSPQLDFVPWPSTNALLLKRKHDFEDVLLQQR